MSRSLKDNFESFLSSGSIWLAELGNKPPDSPPDTLRPTSLTLDLTHRCNYFCRQCVERAARAASSRAQFSAACACGIIRRFSELGGTDLLLYGGEPTLSRNFGTVLRCAAVYMKRILVVTNGSLLHEDRVTEAIKNASSRAALCVRVSLNAGSGAVHDGLHGIEGFFPQIEAGMKYLKSAATACRLEVSYLAEELNSHELEEGYEVACRVGASSFWLRPKTGLHGIGVDPLSDEARLTLLNAAYRLKDQASSPDKPRFFVSPWYLDFLGTNQEPTTTKPYPACYFCASSRLVITPPDPGLVWACTYFRADPRFLVADLGEVEFGSPGFEKMRLAAIRRIRPELDCLGVICNRNAINQLVWAHVRPRTDSHAGFDRVA